MRIQASAGKAGGVLSARVTAEIGSGPEPDPAQDPAQRPISFFADPLGWLLGLFGVT